jgi:CheY-like chemotaxis protein
MLAMLLEASGHQVVVEHDARRALARAKAEVPQVCLLDIGLPEMNGNELAQQLRACAGTAKSVLIAVTGYGQEKDREQSLAAGFDHHLVKPVDTRALTSILDAIGHT